MHIPSHEIEAKSTGKQNGGINVSLSFLVSIELRLKRAHFTKACVRGLFVGHLSEFGIKMAQVKAGSIFIHTFWQQIDLRFITSQGSRIQFHQ